jgi:hypothetical protein
MKKRTESKKNGRCKLIKSQQQNGFHCDGCIQVCHSKINPSMCSNLLMDAVDNKPNFLKIND